MKITDQSDAELIETALEGSEPAWSELVRRHAPLIWSVCRRCGLGQADAEDVAQIVFSAMVRRLPHLKNRSALSGWIVMSAKRESWRVSARNRHRNTQSLETAPVFDADEPDPEVHERQQAIRDALHKLDPTCRDLLNTLFAQAKAPAYDQVATQLQISPNSIGPTRRRCLDKVMKTLQEDHQDLF
ncbi:MAG: sigma-70 family RNA polymerase sigma factor [Phycisphaerales bacterium]|nr:sigma-70 family RNA polymerase sigma factor [Phycisphaerales bacterium]